MNDFPVTRTRCRFLAGADGAQQDQLTGNRGTGDHLEPVIVRSTPAQHRLGKTEFGGLLRAGRIEPPSGYRVLGQRPRHRQIALKYRVLSRRQCPGSIVGSRPCQPVPQVPGQSDLIDPVIAPRIGFHRGCRGTGHASQRPDRFVDDALTELLRKVDTCLPFRR